MNHSQGRERSQKDHGESGLDYGAPSTSWTVWMSEMGMDGSSARVSTFSALHPARAPAAASIPSSLVERGAHASPGLTMNHCLPVSSDIRLVG